MKTLQVIFIARTQEPKNTFTRVKSSLSVKPQAEEGTNEYRNVAQLLTKNNYFIPY